MTTENLGPPKASFFSRLIGKIILSVSGWKVEGEVPNVPKMIMILAPHTSNWDFIFILSVAYSMGVKLNWMGKKELFWGPAGWLFRSMGGIPVDRHASYNTVESSVYTINQQTQAILGITPEATRRKTKFWKSGFYHIAHNANIPITFGYLDYPNKVGGIKPGFMPSGDIAEDLEKIRSFYKGIEGKHPQNYGEIGFKPYVTRPKSA